MDSTNEIRKLGAFIDRLFPEQARTIGAWPPLLNSWSALVGENLGCHCQAREVNHGMLLVDVDHPAWMTQFLFDKENILRRVQAKVPQLEIKNIRLRLVEDLDRPTPEPDIPERNCAIEESKPIPKDLAESLKRLKDVLKD